MQTADQFQRANKTTEGFDYIQYIEYIYLMYFCILGYLGHRIPGEGEEK